MLRHHRPSSATLILILFAVLPAVATADVTDDADRGTLSFDERVACVEKVEGVYWAHRIWPEANRGPKPDDRVLVTRAQIIAKVERSLLLEAALEHLRGEPLTSRTIQEELDRIAESTGHPGLLGDVFAALDHNPTLVAECFVRPRLAERLLHETYSWDRSIHRVLRDSAEAELSGVGFVADISTTTATIDATVWVLADESTPDEIRAANGVSIDRDEWDTLISRLAGRFRDDSPAGAGGEEPSVPVEVLSGHEGRGISSLFETPHGFAVVEILDATAERIQVATASWPKTTLSDWLNAIENRIEPATLGGGTYELPKLAGRDPCTDDTWVATTTTGVPDGRFNHTAIWTGAEMIVWGGRYETWSTMNTGGRYDAAADSWTATTTTDAPDPRQEHTASWTGSVMVVWGGRSGSPGSLVYHDDGGRYDPATDTWASTTMTGAPVGRYGHSAVWTGTEVIVWGGADGGAYTRTGGRYDPSADTWVSTTLDNSPSERQLQTAVWTGSEMIVWGGYPATATGGRYDPTTNTWTSTPTAGAPSARYYHTAVWTGEKMIVWGGQPSASTYWNTGGRFDPATSLWTATSTVGAPDERYGHTAVWTGEEMIVWSGRNTGYLNTGGRYDASSDDWVATTTTDAPTARMYSAAVWTGAEAEMIVWGGSVYVNTGGRYCAQTPPELDFGDAADPTYPTLLANDGARHVLGGGLFLGSLVDAEPDGLPTSGASGDDNDGSDDEDGFAAGLFPIGGTASGAVIASAAGLIDWWIDFNRDGDWDDPGEQVLASAPIGAGTNPFTLPVPADAVPGATAVRLRISTAGGLAPTGLAADGEVEDHVVELVERDFGDAPDPTYPTLSSPNGAYHVIVAGAPLLGASVDGEPDGQPTAGADGDDLGGTDDEDGVVFTSGIGAGLEAALDVTAPAGGMLNAWIDFNADGDWNDAGEQVFADEVLAVGVNSLSIAVPSGSAIGTTYARFRVDSTGGLMPEGGASDGEVEDYQVEILNGPDLQVEMTASSPFAPSGGPLTYTIDVTNNGPIDATSVTLTDTLPSELVFVSSTPGAPDCTFTTDTLTCDLGTMSPTDTTQITLETVLDHPTYGGFSNTADVSAAETDPITANNTATVDTLIGIFIDGFETGDTTRWAIASP